MGRVILVLGLIFGCVGCDLSMSQNKSDAIIIVENKTAKISVPIKINAEELFTISLETAGRAQNVNARLVSATMDMGFVPVMFTSTGNNQYHATTLVGRCSLEKMTWQLEVTWHDNGKTHQLTTPLTINR